MFQPWIAGIRVHFIVTLLLLALLASRETFGHCGIWFEKHSVAFDSASHDPATQERSVDFVTARPGKHGGLQVKIRKVGPHWRSRFALGMVAEQGNPHNFQFLYGIKTASFFGFETVSDQEMWIPDANEFIGALNKLKAKLSRTPEAAHFVPQIQFYPQVHEMRNWESHYLDQFSEQLALPIADHDLRTPEGLVHLVHDLSFHAPSALLLHPDALQLAAKQTKTLSLFSNTVSSLSNLPPNADPQSLSRALLLTRVLFIDEGTANLGVLLGTSLLKGDLAAWRDYLSREYRSLLQNGVVVTRSELGKTEPPPIVLEAYSPEVFPEIILASLSHTLQSAEASAQAFYNQYIDLTRIQNMDAARRIWTQFQTSTTYQAQNWQFPQQANRLISRSPKDIEWICDWTLRAREAIIKAAETLESSAIPYR